MPENAAIMAAETRSTPRAFECWHFDALSDDGREAIVITFNDNYAYSPRHFRQIKSTVSDGKEERFPAVTFTYSVDGKIAARAVNEFRSRDFSCREGGMGCSIGNSSFQVNSLGYGSGFMLHIDLVTPRKCRLEADLEWLSVEKGRVGDTGGGPNAPLTCDIAAPRSDVSGRIKRVGRKGKSETIYHFRGTGYHEHLSGARSINEIIASRWWGRAHFNDCTVIFHREQANATEEASSRLFLLRDGLMSESDAFADAQSISLDRYGMLIPEALALKSEDDVRLRVKPLRTIESGFFRKSMVSEFNLVLGEGKDHRALGIAEFIAPGRMRNKLFRWASDLRIGRNGKSPFY